MSTETIALPCVDCQTPVELADPRMQTMPGLIRCPTCADDLERKAEAEEAQHEAEQARFKARRRLEDSGLPAGLQGLRWSDLDHTNCQDAITAARHWAEHGGGLVLTGPIGVGKTRIAANACQSMLNHRACSWLTAPLLFARLGSGLGSEQRDRALDALTGHGGLVVDDFDKARPTEYGAEHVFLAVDEKITNNAPLLVTTNLSLNELAAKFPQPYGEAIASRLVGYCKIATLSGPDRRVA